MVLEALKSDLKRRMGAAVETLVREFSGLRTGRASTALLDPIQVNAYGAMMPLNQLATVSAPEPRMLSVQVWDASMTKAVEKAIRDSDLGLNPMAEGTVIRIPLPALNQERRQELCKTAAKYAEAARVAVRNVRRDGMDSLKKMEKDSAISEDDLHRLTEEVQDITDQHVKKIDESLEVKEKDIMSV